MTSLDHHYPLNVFNSKDMAVIKEIPETMIPDPKLKELMCPYDELDNPQIERTLSDENAWDTHLFETMKHEVNRLQTFKKKWPLRYVKPADLAESGFFYLQTEDKVQCAFCHMILDDWNVGDKPQKEHMKKSPRCPFLMKFNVGNVPATVRKPTATPVRKIIQNDVRLNLSAYKPKYPRLADVKLRLQTYKDWPLVMLNPKHLAECGFYYTGIADVVTCFFCGGLLGDWKLNDDPRIEHKKYFPHCAYISFANRYSTPIHQEPVTVLPMQIHNPRPLPMGASGSLESELIRQASDIFPRSLVHKVVSNMNQSNQKFRDLHELCEAVLEFKEKEERTREAELKFQKSADIVSADPALISNESNGSENAKDLKDILLCKICMDREKGIVFQPCGHLVSCPQCAYQIHNCPVCRVPITNKVRTYLS